MSASGLDSLMLPDYVNHASEANLAEVDDDDGDPDKFKKIVATKDIKIGEELLLPPRDVGEAVEILSPSSRKDVDALMDKLRASTVCVRPSGLLGAGLGLFAMTDIRQGGNPLHTNNPSYHHVLDVSFKDHITPALGNDDDIGRLQLIHNMFKNGAMLSDLNAIDASFYM
jgi:hypothetical protein